jgi:hypothetical protein
MWIGFVLSVDQEREWDVECLTSIFVAFDGGLVIPRRSSASWTGSLPKRSCWWSSRRGGVVSVVKGILPPSVSVGSMQVSLLALILASSIWSHSSAVRYGTNPY